MLNVVELYYRLTNVRIYNKVWRHVTKNSVSSCTKSDKKKLNCSPIQYPYITELKL